MYTIEYSDELVDIVNRLCNKDPATRLGSKGGAQEVISHPWFDDIDKDALMQFKLDPPFKPGSKYTTVGKDIEESAIEEPNA